MEKKDQPLPYPQQQPASSRFIENYDTFELVKAAPMDLEIILKSDFDKYVNWIMTKEPYSEEEKKKSYESLVESIMFLGYIEDESPTHKKKRLKEAEKEAREEIYVKTKYWRPPSEKEPSLKDFDSNPKEQFPRWRKMSFEEEIRFKFYENSVLPLDVINEKETERIINKINDRYSLVLLDVVEGRLTENYYDLANLIGKIDYLKTLNKVEEKSEPKSLDYSEVALLHWYMEKEITKTNTWKIAEAYNLPSGDQLYKKWIKYRNNSERINEKLKSTNAIKPLLKHFIAILPHLKKSSPKGYTEANREFEILKKKYPQHLPQ